MKDGIIQKNVLLAEYTTFKIGGPAKFFVTVCDKKDLIDVLKWAKEKKEEIFLLGGGSNLLVSDKGFDGLVIRIGNKDFKIDGDQVEAGAGLTLSELVGKTKEFNLSGLEWSVGIPGATVGGSVVGNAGAFGVSMSDLIQRVEVFNLKERKFETFSVKDCEFSYRDSVFKKRQELLVWKIVMRLKKSDTEKINELIQRSIKHRVEKYSKLPSAGSVFKNTGTISELEKHNKEVADEARRLGVVGDSRIIPTGFLIDQLNLKGKKIGGAMISEEHGNFIVNTGEATAEDVIILSSLMKQKVRDNFGIQLEYEIRLVGF